MPARVPRECKINVLGRPTRAILELLLMLSQPLWFPCSRFGLTRPTSTRLTFILGPIMKYHHFMGPGMLGTCWGIIRYQFWNENPLLLLENQALCAAALASARTPGPMAIKFAHGRHRHVFRPERGYNCPPRAPGGGATAGSRRFKRPFFDGHIFNGLLAPLVQPYRTIRYRYLSLRFLPQSAQINKHHNV